jgi:hypothetical protein
MAKTPLLLDDCGRHSTSLVKPGNWYQLAAARNPARELKRSIVCRCQKLSFLLTKDGTEGHKSVLLADSENNGESYTLSAPI